MKVIAFDVFGTVVDFQGVSHDDLKAYVRHVHQPEWSPLTLPASWEKLPAHPDAANGIRRLRAKYFVVTCSNGPMGMLAKLSKHNKIEWDAIIPLELNKTYKPNPKAYMTVCDVLGVQPSDVIMVTANKTFGDIEASKALGMTPVLIRGDADCNDINALAARYGC